MPRAMSITQLLAANSAKRHSVITRLSRKRGSCCIEPMWPIQRAVSRAAAVTSMPSAPAIRPAVAEWTSAAVITSRACGRSGARESSSMPKSSAHSSSSQPESVHRRGRAPPEKIEQ